METSPSARDASREFELPAPPLDRAVHASPLHVPSQSGDARARSRLPMWIVVNALVVSTGIVAAALQVRSERTRAVASEEPDTVVPEHTAAVTAAPPGRTRSETAQTAGAATGAVAVPSMARIPAAAAAAAHATELSAPPAEGPGLEPANHGQTRARASELGANRVGAPRAAARDSARASKANDAPVRFNPWLTPRPRRRGFPRVRYQPSRVQVIDAMQRVAPAVYGCFDGRRGFAMVRLGISGSTGRVQSARVLGQSGPRAKCVARAVRGARFPKFLKPTLKIDYPFKR